MKKSFFASAIAIAVFALIGCNNNPGGGTVEDINIPQLTQSLIKQTPADAEKAVLAKGYIKASAEEAEEYEDAFEYIYSYGQGAKTFEEGKESLIGFAASDNTVNFAQGMGYYEADAVAGKMSSWYNTLDKALGDEDVFYAIIQTYGDNATQKIYYDGKLFNEMLEQAKSVSEELYNRYRSEYATKADFAEDIKSLGNFMLSVIEVKVAEEGKTEGYISQISAANHVENTEEDFIGAGYMAAYGDVSEYLGANNAPAKGIAPFKFKLLKK